jgi:hypothetical protein
MVKNDTAKRAPKRVGFYVDGVCAGLRHEVRNAIAKYLEADVTVSIMPRAVHGLKSGVDWAGLAQQGVSVVVLCEVGDVCAFGISVEAAGIMEVYEYFHGALNKLDGLHVMGKETVKYFHQPGDPDQEGVVTAPMTDDETKA